MSGARNAAARPPPQEWSEMAAVRQTVEHVENLEKYKHGFVTEIDQESAPKGLNEEVVRFISAK